MRGTKPQKSKPISRRKFIDLGVQGYAGVQLAAGSTGSLLALSGCSSEISKTGQQPRDSIYPYNLLGNYCWQQSLL